MQIIKTIDDLLNLQSQYELKNLTYFKEIDGLIVHQEDIFTKYKNIVKQFVKEFTLDDSIRNKYMYDPEKLSIDIYQSPHLDWMILQLNGFESPSRFILGNKLKLIPPGDVDTLFDILRSKNVEELRENHALYDIE